MHVCKLVMMWVWSIYGRNLRGNRALETWPLPLPTTTTTNWCLSTDKAQLNQSHQFTSVGKKKHLNPYITRALPLSCLLNILGRQFTKYETSQRFFSVLCQHHLVGHTQETIMWAKQTLVGIWLCSPRGSWIKVPQLSQAVLLRSLS
jgi:hypothetical protein